VDVKWHYKVPISMMDENANNMNPIIARMKKMHTWPIIGITDFSKKKYIKFRDHLYI